MDTHANLNTDMTAFQRESQTVCNTCVEENRVYISLPSRFLCLSFRAAVMILTAAVAYKKTSNMFSKIYLEEDAQKRSKLTVKPRRNPDVDDVSYHTIYIIPRLE